MRAIICLMLISLLVGPAWAAVDLVTIPSRDGVQLTIYNSEDITMVREQRLLTVKKGVNRVQFTWANTLIDPTSIDFRILAHQDTVDLIDTTFPAGRNDALQWNIQSGMDGKLPVEIRYFTSGIAWSADYVGLANQDETKLKLTGYVRVTNQSGELYDNAETRLVVGKINLVERIADLATRPVPGGEYWGRDADARGDIRKEFAKKAMDYESREKNGKLDDSGLIAEGKKEVAKQGLSEYFLFTIAGREDIKNNEPKRLVSMEIDEVPLDVIYKLSDRINPILFTKYYRFNNQKLLDEAGEEKNLSAMNNLGESPLPDGNVRLFSEYDNQDLAYVGGTATKYVPIGDRVEVNVGNEPSVTMKKVLKDRRITNVVSRQYKRRLNNTYVRYYDLIDFDETLYFEEEITSGKPVDIKLDVERRFDANVLLWSPSEKATGFEGNEPGAYIDMHELDGRVERVDENHVKYFVDLNPGEKRVIQYTVTYKRRKVGPELNTYDRREPVPKG